MFPIVEKLGGRKATLDALNKRLPRDRGPRTEYAIIKWWTNREIPIRCRWALEREAEERGIKFSQNDFEAPKEDAGAAA